jgi:tol-pal system protein YbgF
MRRAPILKPLVLSALMFAPAVLADDVTRLQHGLAEKQDRLSALQAEAGSLLAQMPGAADVPVTAQLTIRIQQLESELRQLTGQVEDLSYTLQQLKAKQERFQNDVEYRLSELEKAAPVGGAPVQATAPAAPARAAGQVPPTAVTPPGAPPRDLGSVPANALSSGGPVQLSPQAAAPTAPRPTPDAAAPATPAAAAVKLPSAPPKQQYEYAFEFVKKQDYPSAEQALRAFVAAHPNDELAGNAQYWLGETFYVRGNFNEAAANFLSGYQKYPKSPKAPDNLLKLGLSLANTGKNKEACAAYARFNSEYAAASEFLKRRVREERTRLACG